LTTPDDLAEIKVHLQHPIKDVFRVALKSFTVANSGHNVLKFENELSWYEFFKPSGSTNYTAKPFKVTIPPGYYTSAELLAKINTTITNWTSSEHQVVAETPLGINFTQHTSRYNTEITLIHSGLGDKWFAPVIIGNEGDVPLWKRLGFSESQIINAKNGNLTSRITEIQSALQEGTVGSISAVLTQANADSSKIDVVSHYASTIENPGGLYIVSDKLTSGSTYETRLNPDRLHTEARPENIFEWVQFGVDRYYWVQHRSDVLHWHYLNGATINEFDIRLESEARTPLNHKGGIGEYNLVLVFETIDHDEYTAEYVRQYNADGYALAHTPQTIRRP
jgi:hypothetical protein